MVVAIGISVGCCHWSCSPRHYFHGIVSMVFSFGLVSMGLLSSGLVTMGLAPLVKKAWDWCNPILINTTLSISTLRDRDALEYFLSHTARYSYLLEKIAPNLEDSITN